VTKSLVSIPSRSEGVCKEGAGGDVGRAKQTGRTPREGARHAREDAMELARQRTAADKVVTDAAAVARAEQARTDEATVKKANVEEAAPSCAAIDKAAAEAAAARALSGETGQGEFTGTDTPAPEERAGEVADLTRTGANAGPGGASQEPPEARYGP
jgi:hypothetical protein